MFVSVSDELKLTEKIALQIKNSIEEGRYQPGDKLPSENQLAEMFKVSRTSIREAVKILGGQGLIEVRRGVGIFVADAAKSDDQLAALAEVINMQKDQLFELFQVRRILEQEMAGQAALNITPSDVEKLKGFLATAELAAKNPENRIEIINKINFEFHSAILEIAGNKTIQAIMSSLNDALYASRNLTLQLPGRYLLSIASHKEVLEALMAGDVERSRAAMNQHLLVLENSVREILQRQNKL